MTKWRLFRENEIKGSQYDEMNSLYALFRRNIKKESVFSEKLSSGVEHIHISRSGYYGNNNARNYRSMGG